MFPWKNGKKARPFGNNWESRSGGNAESGVRWYVTVGWSPTPACIVGVASESTCVPGSLARLITTKGPTAGWKKTGNPLAETAMLTALGRWKVGVVGGIAVFGGVPADPLFPPADGSGDAALIKVSSSA
jgi:hypothetical protein